VGASCFAFVPADWTLPSPQVSKDIKTLGMGGTCRSTFAPPPSKVGFLATGTCQVSAYPLVEHNLLTALVFALTSLLNFNGAEPICFFFFFWFRYPL